MAGLPKIPFSPEESIDKYGMLAAEGQQSRYFPIAIVGIGLRMPAAENVSEFEKVLINEECGITPVPEDRWTGDFYHTDPLTKGCYVIPKLGFCDKYYHFDAGYFNMSPRETLFTDPQQRQTLEITDEALQDAGYTKHTLPKDTGVYVGMGIIDIPGSVVENRFFYNGHTLTGFSHSCAANRISHHYGLTGPSIAVDTACAASLTALHVGCMSIWNGENKIAIAGATSNMLSPETTVAFSQLGVLSPRGNSAPFDHTNDGYVRAEGTGMVIMKPLHDALKDGDHIYCVIRGSTSAHNGNSNSLTLPSADAQEELIRRCYDQFKIPLEKVSFVEAHGTGTPVGDPLETKALGRTFGASRKDPMPIASAKSNFGHLEVAAGMVQVVKAALMLDKRTFYKQLNWTAPNPRIDFTELNLRMQLKHEPYTKKEKFVIGVNTFGFGGSIVHMIFEEYRPTVKALPEDTMANWQFGDNDRSGRKIAIPLSAKVDIALRNTAAKWSTWSDESDAQSVAGWLATRREHHNGKRLVILAESGNDFQCKIQNYLNGEICDDIVVGSVPTSYTKPAVCLVYPGWGQQWSDMGRQLYKNAPAFRLAVHTCDESFKSITGYSALEKFQLFVELPESEKADPSNINGAACKPAILFFQVGLTALLSTWGLKADMVFGLGLGEQVAAYAAGAMSLADIIRLMVIRMKSPPKEDFIVETKKELTGSKASTARFFSTIIGNEYNGNLDADYWWQNVTNDARIDSTINAVIAANPNTVFIEIAGTSMLSNQIIEALGSNVKANTVLCCGVKEKDDWASTLHVMAQMYVSGYPIDWKSVSNNIQSYAPIPTYGWDDREYRIESQEYTARRLGVGKKTFKSMNGKITHHTFAYLRDYVINDETVFPTAAFVEYFSEYDSATHIALKDIKILKNTLVLPLTQDGYIQETSMIMQRNKSFLSVINDIGEVQAKAVVTTARPLKSPGHLDISAIKSRCLESRSGQEIYQRFAELGLSYGTLFRLLTDLFVGESEAIAFVGAPHMKSRNERIQTLVLDSAFQTAINAFTRGSGLYLPQYISRIQMFIDKVPPTTAFCVYTTLDEWSLRSITCDIKITDVEGNLWLMIEGFRADNQEHLTTEVDYQNCCYTIQTQIPQAVIPATAGYQECLLNMDTSGNQYNAQSLQLLKPLVAALANEVVGNMEKNTIATQNLQRLSQSAPEGSDTIAEITENISKSAPHLSFDITYLRDIAEAISKLQHGTEAPQEVINFVKDADSLMSLFTPYVSMIQKYVQDALGSKAVIRICEIGELTGAFTKLVVAALQHEIDRCQVEYVYADYTEEHFKSINDSLKDMPEIKFAVINEESLPTMKNSFDIVLRLDWQGSTTSALCDMNTFLKDNGQLYVIQNTNGQFMTDFLFCNQESKVGECKSALIDVGMTNVTAMKYCDETWFTIFIGQKTVSRQAPNTDVSFIVVHNGASEFADTVSKKFPDGTLVYDCDNFFKSDVLKEHDSIEIVFLLSESASMMAHAIQMVETIKTNEAIKTIYCFGDSESNATAACLGFLRANSNELPIYTVDSMMDSQSKVNTIIDIVKHSVDSDRDISFGASGAKVPRIVRLDSEGHTGKDYIWKIQHEGLQSHISKTSLQFKSAKCAEMEPEQVKVRVRSTTLNEYSEQSVVAFSGTVDACGAPGNSFALGSAVMGLTELPIASHVICTSQTLQKKPNHFTWSEASSSMLSFCTVYNTMIDEANLTTEDTILIHPSTGYLAQAAISVAKSIGARVICTFKDNEDYKSIMQTSGLVALANPYAPSFKKDILQFTNNKGLDVVFQVTSENLPESCADVMSYGVRICKVGSTRTTATAVPNARYTTMHLSSYMKRSENRIHNTAHLIADNLDNNMFNPITIHASHISNANIELPALFTGNVSNAITLEIPDDFHPLAVKYADFRLHRNGTYVVADGCNELGLEVARWLSGCGAKSLVLMTQHEQNDRFTSCTKQYMEANGTAVSIIHTDLTDNAAVMRVFGECIELGLPRIRGIFNVIEPTSQFLYGEKEEMILAMNSYITASRNLDEATASLGSALDYFVLMGAIDGFVTNSRIPYVTAIGCEFDRLCETRRSKGLSALSVHLGQIRGAGVVSQDPELAEVYDQIGCKSMHFHEYLTILGDILQRDNVPSCIAVANQDWSKMLRNGCRFSLRFNHLIQDNGLGESTSVGDVRQEMEQTCREYISNLTGSSLEVIDPSHSVTEYGVDSLMSQDIMSWAQKAFKITLLQTDIFGGLTINQLLAKVFG